MTQLWRLALLIPALIVLTIAAGHVILTLPAFGDPLSQYGHAVNALTPTLRNVSNMVSAVNFDIRSIDTLGEESMLICAVTATVVLLRGRRGEDIAERAGHLPGREWLERTDATVLICRLIATVLFLFGLSLTLHGTVTPGSGFQGGAIVASGFVLIYLGEGYSVWRRVMHSEVLVAVEGFGGLAFALAMIIPLALGYAAGQNVLPLGTWKDLYSGGLMVIVNMAVGVAVVGGFGVLLLEFMEETRAPETGDIEDEEDE